MIEIERISYSTFAGWLRCGKALYLKKFEQVPQTPAWPLVGGSSVHAVTESWERMYEAQKKGETK